MHGNLVLEVMRGEKTVAYVWHDGTAVSISRKDKREFDSEYYRDAPLSATGKEPTARGWARHYLTIGDRLPIADGAAELLVDLMTLTKDEPRSNKTAILTAPDGQLIGAYETRHDANLVGRFVNGVVISAAVELGDWGQANLAVLQQQVAPKLKALKTKSKLLEGIFEMAKKADKPAAPAVSKKVEAVKKERPPKTDGPVAKVAAYIQANMAKFKDGSLTRTEATDALKAMGIVKGTVGVQLPKQLKALGIDAVKGTRAKPKVDKPAKVAKTNGDAAPAAAKSPLKGAKVVGKVAKTAAPTKAKVVKKGATKAKGKGAAAAAA